MSKTNLVQNEIRQLEGGAFQKMFDEYLYKKYKFTNIQTLGVQAGTNKSTKGVPDTYVITENNQYILINYGTVNGGNAAKKIEQDILDCFDTAKLSLEKDRIAKIICGHCSTNIRIEQFDSLRKLIEGIEVELIGIDTLSYDLVYHYPNIAKEHLHLNVDTNQMFDIDDFVKKYDANGIVAPLNCTILHREIDLCEVEKSIKNNRITVLTGESGVGKSRLALEACRHCEESGIKVYGVISNGLLLYEDIRFYIDQAGRYLVFLDDANMIQSLNSVVDTIIKMPQEIDVKILITVRDYAKELVIKELNKYCEPSVIEVNRFNSDEIRDILKENLGIFNGHYLNKIAEISNGNIRLAIMAGLKSREEGFDSICNAEDIFNNYYGRILDDAKLTRGDVLLLFAVAVSGPVYLKNNSLYQIILEQCGKDIIESESLSKLYSLELLDWFKDEIIKISDQSLSNYILYYVIFVKKWVKIDSLIENAFPQNKNKIVYALNTLLDVFRSEELTEYITNSISKAWDKAPKEQEREYLESFHNIDPIESLSIIKQIIIDEETVDFDLYNFDFESAKRNVSIQKKEIDILGDFKHEGCLEDAVNLLLMYFEKRPDLIMDVYFTVTRKFLFDKYSSTNEYEPESFIMNKLWKKTQEGRNYAASVLYMNVAEYALKTEIEYTETVKNSRSINFVRMSLPFCNELSKIRMQIWSALRTLYSDDRYHETIDNIIIKTHISLNAATNPIEYLRSDFEAVYTNFLSKDSLNFREAKIIGKYYELASRLDAPIDERYYRSNENEEYVLYQLLSGHQINGKDYEDNERLHRKVLEHEVETYKLDDYAEMFNICATLEGMVTDPELWKIKNSLSYIFELLETQPTKYKEVLKIYLTQNAPFDIDGLKMIRYLLEHFDYQETKSILFMSNYKGETRWRFQLWESVKKELIGDNIADDFKLFLADRFDQNCDYVPSVTTIYMFGQIDPDIYRLVRLGLAKNNLLARMLLGGVRDDSEVDELIYIFGNDGKELSNVYITVLDCYSLADYEGKIFKALMKIRPEIWLEYISWLSKNNWECHNWENVIEGIWRDDAWNENIKSAFYWLKDNYKRYVNNPTYKLFPKTKDVEVMSRMRKWLMGELKSNTNNIDIGRTIVDVVVSRFPKWKTECLLVFLHGNKSLDDFKSLHLFSLSESWTGSEVPLILDKIHFLESFEEKLGGVDLLEHRQYIREYCSRLKQYKDTVELREYIENGDYA